MDIGSAQSLYTIRGMRLVKEAVAGRVLDYLNCEAAPHDERRAPMNVLVFNLTPFICLFNQQPASA